MECNPCSYELTYAILLGLKGTQKFEYINAFRNMVLFS